MCCKRRPTPGNCQWDLPLPNISFANINININTSTSLQHHIRKASTSHHINSTPHQHDITTAASVHILTAHPDRDRHQIHILTAGERETGKCWHSAKTGWFLISLLYREARSSGKVVQSKCCLAPHISVLEIHLGSGL